MSRKKLVEMLKKAGYSQKTIENIIEFYQRKEEKPSSKVKTLNI